VDMDEVDLRSQPQYEVETKRHRSHVSFETLSDSDEDSVAMKLKAVADVSSVFEKAQNRRRKMLTNNCKNINSIIPSFEAVTRRKEATRIDETDSTNDCIYPAGSGGSMSSEVQIIEQFFTEDLERHYNTEKMKAFRASTITRGAVAAIVLVALGFIAVVSKNKSFGVGEFADMIEIPSVKCYDENVQNDICHNAAFENLGDYVRCQTHCASKMCCFDDLKDGTCEEECENYSSCSILLTDRNISIENLCSRDSILSMEGYNACQNACSKRLCCFLPQADCGKCSVGAKQWCEEFDECNNLYNYPPVMSRNKYLPS